MRRTRLLENEIRVLKDESTRLGLEQQGNKEKVKDNLDKIKLNRQLPYLVGNVVEVLDQVPEVRGPARSWPSPRRDPHNPSARASVPRAPRTRAIWAPPARERRAIQTC